MRTGSARSQAVRWIGAVSGYLIVALGSFAAAASLGVSAANDTSLCKKVAEAIEKNVGSGGRLRSEAEPFSTIGWEPVQLAGAGPKTRHCSILEKALIDLNNDGQRDLVVRTTFCMKGAPSDSFYLFPADSAVLNEATWQDLSPLLATPHKFERTGGSYPLAALPMDKLAPALTTTFAIRPFVQDGTVYVTLTDARQEWMVVAKYVGGERFEDRCYLRASSR